MTTSTTELGDRLAAEPDVRRNFLLQSMWCLFAEDLGQLEGHLFTRIVDGLIEDPQTLERRRPRRSCSNG